jgi:hypothetical protein
LAGAKNQTGQTVPEKKVLLSKLNLKFFPHHDHHDKHKRPHCGLISIKGDIFVSLRDKHKRPHHRRLISIKGDIVSVSVISIKGHIMAG